LKVLCTFLVLIKFHELCCDFHRKVHILGEIGTNTTHVLGTAEPLGTTGPAPCRVPSRKHRLVLKHNLDEQDSHVGLIKWWRLGSLGSMGPLIRSLNCHNHHPEVILGVPEQSWSITRHGGGPATPINSRARRNRPKEPTYNCLRSSDQERPSREAAHHRTGRTCDVPPPALHRPSLHLLDRTHDARASPFPSFVHLGHVWFSS
jgi:hypothetical protein